ncbi:UDP-N-acetylmuramoyl-L-alanyl-D-glutamate--2,6-diaminopimelate ligase [Clostridium hydrogeniformans]|uniref:UDP-N-acetylmuramoyl-L-alanyl-D-glutamate--2, 6-diaminopimelate ligase n=1 Tax=Clostridium hydrogeniformans TaxID=349933 RepID=UPI0004870A8A|nr:UDP-N-acetylmuramoyl-L-alanyl-D-glutamate--2,6-diaminopimelate ligase [Clostridium hydrogeniformans]
MNLKDILKDVEFEVLQGDLNRDINKLAYNSREVEQGDLFFCIKGFKVDGHKYFNSAVDNGAKVIICEDDLCSSEEITILKVKDSRKALAICSKNYYKNPCGDIKIIGITGTNGKTTSAFMMKSILEEAGFKVGLIGTVANYIGDKKLKSERTTPESLELQKLFRDMVDNGVEYCVMEVSSHSLYLDRVYGIEFITGIFTNLTQDHLDFHETLENYFNAKKILFNVSKNKVINIDDEHGKRIVEEFKDKVLTFGRENNGDLNCSNIINEPRGAKFNLDINGNNHLIELNIPGIFNVYNALGVIGASLLEDIDMEIIKNGLKKSVVPGRCEIISNGMNLEYDIVVDYAHSPDGLENILKCAREFTKGRLIGVFGCGGDRDKTKRPIMGEIGVKLCDIAVITSDNPRTEDPMDIINDILEGVKKDNYKIIENRKEAIKEAINIAGPLDVIVIAGKGHEDYQVLKDKTIHFDEREIVKDILEESK